MLLISARILDHLQKLQSYWKWDKDRVSNSSGLGYKPEPKSCNELYHTKTRNVANGLVSLPKPRHFNITTLAPINYLSSDCIVTWSVCRLCCSSCSFTSSFHICDPTNICWVAIENMIISRTMCLYFRATQRISVGSQIWKSEVKERLELHNLHTYHVMIQSELKYLTTAKVAGTIKWNRGLGTTRPTNEGLCPVQVTPPPRQCRSGFWPDLEPNQTKPPAKYWTTGRLPRPVANNTQGNGY